jgi:putative membrane protein
MGLLLRILANMAAVLIAAKLVSGFTFAGTPVDLLIAGVVLALVNLLVKPVIQIISLPVIFLTLGIFNIIINIVLLFFAARFIPYLHIENVWAAFWGIIIISVVNHLVTSIFNRHDRGNINNL